MYSARIICEHKNNYAFWPMLRLRKHLFNVVLIPQLNTPQFRRDCTDLELNWCDT